MNNLPPLSQENKNKIDGFISEVSMTHKIVSESLDLWEDFGMDSLDEIELIMMIEKEFSISIKDENFANNKTVADLYHTVNWTLHLKYLYSGMSDEEKIELEKLIKKDSSLKSAIHFKQAVGRTKRNFTQESFDLYPNNEISNQ